MWDAALLQTWIVSELDTELIRSFFFMTSDLCAHGEDVLDTLLSAIKKAVLKSGRGMTWYHSGIVNPLLAVTQEMADIKVVLSLLKHTHKYTYAHTHTTALWFAIEEEG